MRKKFTLLYIFLLLAAPVSVLASNQPASQTSPHHILLAAGGCTDVETGLTVDCGTPSATGGYVPLAPLQDPSNNNIPYDPNNFSGYILGMYKLLIGLSGILAIVVIIYGGILYMSTDAYGKKTEGKDIIKRALWGLLIIIGSALILNTINPQILNLSHIFTDFTAGSNAAKTAPAPAPAPAG